MAPHFLNQSVIRGLNDFKDQLPEVYLVGGAVRDLLRLRAVNDLDVVCRGAAEFAARLARASGAALVRFDNKPGEVCHRVVDRADPDTFLDAVELHGPDIVSDLKRRDFTINAMAMRIYSGGQLGEVIDPLGGRSDLKKGIVRMTGPDALIDDPLRILRAWRFAAELGFGIDGITREYLRLHAESLSGIAVERIVFELFRILSVSDAAVHLREMAQMGVLDAIFPEKAHGTGAPDASTVWENRLTVVGACEAIVKGADAFFGGAGRLVAESLAGINRLPLLKLAALFHDLGRTEKSGVSAIPEEIALRLKLSYRDRGLFLRVFEGLTAFSGLAASDAKPSELVRLFRSLGDDGLAAIMLGMAVDQAEGAAGPKGSSDALRQAVSVYFTEIKDRLAAKSLIDGDDLKAMGMDQGPELGALLREVRRAQDEGKITTREEALSLARRLLSKL